MIPGLVMLYVLTIVAAATVPMSTYESGPLPLHCPPGTECFFIVPGKKECTDATKVWWPGRHMYSGDTTTYDAGAIWCDVRDKPRSLKNE